MVDCHLKSMGSSPIERAVGGIGGCYGIESIATVCKAGGVG